MLSTYIVLSVLCSIITTGLYITEDDTTEGSAQIFLEICLGPVGFGMKIGKMFNRQRRMMDELAALIRNSKGE